MALAGADGARLAKLIGASKAYGVRIMSELVSDALSTFVNRSRGGRGVLFSSEALTRLAGAIAAVNSTADLLGRYRVREQADRAETWKGSDRPQDAPFSAFADDMPGVLATPEDALAYFLTLRPELGVDPKRFVNEQRRQAFTLAASTNQTLTAKVQKVIADALRANRSTGDAQTAIRKTLEAAGVGAKNGQYAEMVFRTNAMDSYQTAAYEEGRHPEVAELFPVWQYLGIDDERAGEDHRPKFDKFYPSSAAFAEVRGNRPFNCRCGMKWIDSYDWADYLRRGANVEARW